MLAERLANQRLTGPLAESPVQVVRELLAVQAQDAPMARAMIAVRSGTDEAAVLRLVAEGRLIRTHVLRPTWHYVLAEDLRWLLAATATKVESGLASRHRQLSLDAERIEAGLAVISHHLSGRNFTNRTSIGSALLGSGVIAGDALFGQRIGHLLMIAELRALICSAPVALPEHHYALVDDVLPAPDPTPAPSLTELAYRFCVGHGPVALSDLRRWAGITVAQARTALAGSALETVEVDGEELWRSPTPLPPTRSRPALLLSTFDEAFLSYRAVGWPRSPGHPLGEAPYTFAQSSGGVVLWQLADVGSWRRVRSSNSARIELTLDAGLSPAAVAQIEAAAAALLAILSSFPSPQQQPLRLAEQPRTAIFTPAPASSPGPITYTATPGAVQQGDSLGDYALNRCTTLPAASYGQISTPGGGVPGHNAVNRSPTRWG